MTQETGSLVNHLQARMVIGQPEPVVGMGVTVLHWTDRSPATIINTSGNMITIQGDNAVRIDNNGMSESQEYEFTPNPKGGISTFRRNKNGMWDKVRFNKETNRWNKVEGERIRIGERNKYHDFSF